MNISKRKFRSSVLVKSIMFSFIPIVVMFFIVITIMNVQMKNIKAESIKRFTNGLTTNIVQLDSAIKQIVDDVELLCFEDVINEFLMDENYEERISKDYTIQNILQRYKNTHNIVANIALINRYNNFVLDQANRTSASNYYTENRIYSGYDTSFWDNPEVSERGLDIMSPVKVTAANKEKMVVPIIIGTVNNKKTKNPIVIDISCEDMVKIFNNASAGDYMLFIEQNKNLLPLSADAYENISDDEVLAERVVKERIFEYEFNKEKYFVISHKDNTSFLNNYRYVIMIPASVVFKAFNSGYRIVYAVLFVSMLFMLVLSIYFNKKLYNPLFVISKRLYGESGFSDARNEFDLISEKLDEMLHKNQRLQSRIEEQMSVFNGKLILEILDSNGYIDEKEIDDVFGGKIKKDDEFFVAYISMTYTDKFYEMFTVEQYVKINMQLNSILTEYFSENKKVFLLLKSKEDYVLINTEPNKKADAIDNLKRAVSFFEYDKELINVFVGVGNIYSGYEGMRKSYNEALAAKDLAKAFKYDDVFVYRNEAHKLKEYKYSLEQESNLLNFIIKGDVASVMRTLDDILADNKNIDKNSLKKLYANILQTVRRAARIKEIDLDEYLGEEYSAAVESVEIFSEKNFVELCTDITEKVTAYKSAKNTVVDISGLVQYIDAHYSEECYLDNMADKLNTSPRYLSRLFKEQLGMNFSQYVAKVRINKAKELLVGTNINISEIMVRTGFVGRNTFVRVFKKFEGVTPSEYRKMMSKNEIAKELKQTET